MYKILQTMVMELTSHQLRNCHANGSYLSG